MNCSHCRAPVQPGWRACPTCGTQFTSPVPLVTASKKLPALFAGLLAVVGFIFIGFIGLLVVGFAGCAAFLGSVANNGHQATGGSNAPITAAEKAHAADKQSQDTKIAEQKKAEYTKAFDKFQKEITNMTGVAATEQFGPDGFRIYVAGEVSDYDARKVGQPLYDRFYAMRKNYMNDDEARSCTVFVYDDTKREMLTVSYWNR